MTSTIRIPVPARSIYRTWIETGDPRQPLASVWIDAPTTYIAYESDVSSTKSRRRSLQCG